MDSEIEAWTNSEITGVDENTPKEKGLYITTSKRSRLFETASDARQCNEGPK